MKMLRRILNLALVFYLTILAMTTVPALLGFQIYTVISGSMAPALTAGTVVYVLPKNCDAIQEGDIITFLHRESGICVTHRVLEKHGDRRTFTTKGDANELPDGAETAYADVVGKVTFAVPYLGYAAVALESLPAKILAAGALLWLILIRAILTNLMEIKRREADII